MWSDHLGRDGMGERGGGDGEVEGVEGVRRMMLAEGKGVEKGIMGVERGREVGEGWEG